MIKSIDIKTVSTLKVNIIPKLKEYNTISLSEGDTLVMFVDREKWDLKETESLFQQVEKAFPHNNILCMFDGIELGVIKRDEK